VLFLASILVLLLLLIIGRPREALTGLFIVLLGVPVSWRVVRLHRFSTEKPGYRPAGDVSAALAPSTESSTVSTVRTNP